MRLSILAFLSLALLNSAKAQLSPPDTLHTDLGVLSIQPVQHAGLVLTVKGKTIYADPYGGAKNFKGLPAPDLVLITDIHSDHFDIETLTSLIDAHSILVVPKVVADKMPASVTSKILVLKNGGRKTLLGISILAIPMYNLPESPTAMHTKG